MDENNKNKISQPPDADGELPQNVPKEKKSGLKVRSITGLVIIAVYVTVILLTVLLHWWFVFTAFVVLVTLGVALEIGKAIANKHAAPVKPFVIVSIIAGFAAFYIMYFTRWNASPLAAYFSMIAFTVLILFVYVMFTQKHSMKNIVSTLFVLIYPVMLSAFMLGLNHLPRIGFSSNAILMLFLIPAFSDTGAYLVGSLIRGPKLAPKISPKKTVSGAVGGVLGGMLAGAVVLAASIFSDGTVARLSVSVAMNIVHHLIIGAVGAVFVMVGDLVASYIKRQCEVKDFGKLLPGHGGITDRIDSMLICAVFLYAYYIILCL
ncbi:MAG: phosphatidate cytidylyltransferase [Firmicutes bacterium]|nr:phosphatidate cytidylyltransferase [Bacillota bacterium]